MKRSTKVFLGAMGLVTAGWGIERAMTPNLPACPLGPDGKPIVTPGCEVPPGRSSSSSSSGSRGWYGSSGGSSSSSSSHASTGVGHVTSTGGWGSFGRGFSSGG